VHHKADTVGVYNGFGAFKVKYFACNMAKHAFNISDLIIFFFAGIFSIMPITSSAKKALRASKRKRVFNLRRKNEMQNVIKEYKKLIFAKKINEAQKLIPKLQKAIDKAAKRGLIKKNTAARKKSRLIQITLKM